MPDAAPSQCNGRCYLLSLPDWLNLMSIGDIETLAAKVIPALGSEEFFELW